MSIIRLTKTKEMEKILSEIRRFYPLLDDAEIIKMIVSEYYSNLLNVPVKEATPEEERMIKDAKQALKARKIYKVIHPEEEVNLDFLLQ